MIRVIRVIVVMLLCLGGVVAVAGLDEALDAKARGDGKTAITEFSRLADKGDVRAMLTIGVMYMNAEGVMEDYGKALDWFLKAAAKDDADALNNIGVMYRDALGVKQDLELAYALFLQASQTARNDDTYGRVARNLSKISQFITTEQLARAKKLTASDLTADKLRKHVPSADAARRDTTLLPQGWQKQLKTAVQEVKLDRTAKSPLEVLSIRNDEYTDMPGTLAFSSGKEESPEKFLTAGVYSNSESRIMLEVPRFSTGMITLHQSKLSGSSVYMLRISDGKVAELEPWVLPDDSWHGVVITTHLPADWADRGTEAFDRIVEMQEGGIEQIPENMAAATILSSPQGKISQTIVLNQTTTPLYPQSDARVLPVSEGLNAIGISRMMYRDNMIIHLALIVKKPKNRKDLDFLEFAVSQMEDLQARFALLPKAQSGK